MAISLEILLFFSTTIFLFGILGIALNKRNLLIILMSIELMLVGLNLNFIFFSVYLDDIIGQIFALYVLTVAAAETSIGLSILILYYRVKGSVAIEFLNILKG